MTKTDSLFRLSDPVEALGLLSRHPVTLRAVPRGAAAAWAYPLAGVVLGGLATVMAAGAMAVGVPAVGAALLAIATLSVTTGGLHEDGLADTADGLWGGWTRERRLEIMKDSHIGSYGVIALVLSLMARVWAVSVLLEAGQWPALVAVAALSRAVMPLVMFALPHARAGGLSQQVGRPARATVVAGMGLGAAIALVALGPAALGLGLLGMAAALTVGVIARAKIGGQTGDILGATQQVTEITVLFALTALV